MDREPQVGDLLLLDGRMRRIVIVNGGVVEFDHPDEEAEEKRRRTMDAWKARRDAWTSQKIGEAKANGSELSYGDADGAYRVLEPPPELSRRGSVGVVSLDWYDGGNFWGVRDRLDGRKHRIGAVVLAPAAAALLVQEG